MGKMGMSFTQEDPPQAARDMRSAFLKAWGECCEKYMRSPEFLNAIKQSMGGAIEFRRQLNDMLGKLQHELQGISRQDVDQMMLAMRHLEQRMVDGMDRLSATVETIAVRLDALEKGKSARRPVRRTATKKKTPRSSAKKKRGRR